MEYHMREIDLNSVTCPVIVREKGTNREYGSGKDLRAESHTKPYHIVNVSVADGKLLMEVEEDTELLQNSTANTSYNVFDGAER